MSPPDTSPPRQIPPVPERCDVVVIGAGMSGLVAGALLSKAGLDVVVVDAETRPGGYLAGFRRKKFVFDTAIHWLNQCGPGGLVYRVLSYLGDDFPRCKPLAAIRRYQGDSFDVLLTRDPDSLKTEWLRRYPEDRAGIERFFRDAWKVGERMATFSDMMCTPEMMSVPERLLHLLRAARWGMPLIAKYKLTAEEGLRRYFTNPELRRTFATEKNLMSILVPVGWAYHGDYQAAPPGGSQTIPRWLVAKIEAAGSHVVLGRRVQRVLLERGGVAGVELAARPTRSAPEQTIACRHVVASCDALTLFEKLLPAGTIDATRIERLRSMDLYPSSFTISLGLDCPAEELGFGEEMVILTRDDVPRAEQTAVDPERCAITILAPSTRDPSLAPPGKGTLTVFTEAHIGYGDHWRTGPGFERGAAYRAFKEQYADTVLRRIERRRGIDLRGHVEVRAIATPITHWRYTGNHQGSIMGGRPSRANIRQRLARYRTPVDRLVLGGHWAAYGGGVPVATGAGANASALVLAEADRSEYRRLRAMLAGR